MRRSWTWVNPGPGSRQKKKVRILVYDRGVEGVDGDDDDHTQYDKEGEGHELGYGVSNGSHTAHSRPARATRERLERACPAASAQGTAGSRILDAFPTSCH